MALFKILRGDISRISTDITPFHEGYAYFTPDDGGFYIDAISGSSSERIRINPTPSSEVHATLTASGWSNGSQTVQVPGMAENQNGYVGIAQSATTVQVRAATNAAMRVTSQTENALTILTDGAVPDIDIPITVILLG